MSSLKDEQEWQDRIELQEHEDCNQDHSPTGLCPCCGVELDRVTHYWGGDFDDDSEIEEERQICPSCGWTSVYFYGA